jgi:transcriptional regulator with XRE-family HTH domain
MPELATQSAEVSRYRLSTGMPVGPLSSPELDSAEIAGRLRRIRLAKKFKLREVAEATGTTPQTIQRLESGGMSLTVEWVLKICKALAIDPAYLFRSDDKGQLAIVATINERGDFENLPDSRHEAVTLAGAIKGAFGIRVNKAVGRFDSGDILIATLVNPHPPANRDWGPCLIHTADQPPALCHVFQTVEGRWITVALDQSSPARFSATVNWLARIITVVRHLPEIREGGALEHVDRALASPSKR